jgi:hypothetical protein
MHFLQLSGLPGHTRRPAFWIQRIHAFLLGTLCRVATYDRRIDSELDLD